MLNPRGDHVRRTGQQEQREHGKDSRDQVTISFGMSERGWQIGRDYAGNRDRQPDEAKAMQDEKWPQGPFSWPDTQFRPYISKRDDSMRSGCTRCSRKTGSSVPA